ncbi:hypothetical protein VM1G_02778 [Cytospora mali]|uniref:Uncharacterized protein n=1 Tax=Cytospora mali TaxID=578113 RepID=A0A194VTU7_CYTMA|nr:hypothetical protein VM1G_02778 [Valsa mali]
MERIRCNCKQCGSKLGEFVNLWTQVGKSYCTPVVQPFEPLNIQHDGEARLGDSQTLVDGCSSDQVLFRFSSVEPVSYRGAKRVEFMVKRTLQLRFPPPYFQDPSAPSVKPESVDLSHIQASLDLNRKDIDRLDTAGFRVVSALDEAVQRIEAETKKLQKSVQDLRTDSRGTNHDIAFLKTQVKNIKQKVDNGTTSVIVRLESQVQSIGEAIPGLRTELGKLSTKSEKDIQRLGSQLSQAKEESGQLKSIITSNVLSVKEHAKEMKSLQGEVSTLKDLLNRSPAPQPMERSTRFSDRELDILTDNIARLGNRTSQVETLQMQFEIMKGRLERMESNRQSASMTPAHPSNYRKRSPEDVQEIETSPGSHTALRVEPINASSAKRPRLTRSGTVDERTHKRSSKRS